MGEGAAPEGARKKLPVIATARETYAVILRNPGTFLRAAFAPSLILILLSLSPLIFASLWHKPNVSLIYLYFFYLSVVLFVLAGAWLSVSWQRLLIFERLKAAPEWISPWRRPHRLFFLLAIFMALLPFFALSLALAGLAQYLDHQFGGPLTWLQNTFLFVFSVLAVGLWLRISLVFAATAVGAKDYGLGKAWRDTKGNGLRLIFAALFIWLPLAAIHWATISFFNVEPYHPREIAGGIEALRLQPALLSLARIPIQVLEIGVIASFIAIAFQHLANWSREQDSGRYLPVLQTVVGSFAVVARNLRAFLVLASVPAAIFVLQRTSFLVEFEAFIQRDEGVFFSSILPDIVRVAIEALAFIYFAVAWHRFLLLTSTEGKPKVLRTLNVPYWRYLIYASLIFGIPYLAFYEFFAGFHFLRLGGGGLVWSLLLLFPIEIIVSWILLRACLVFPGSAVVANGYGVKQAWRDTRGNAPLILTALALIYVPIALLGWLIDYLDHFIPYGIAMFEDARAITLDQVADILLSVCGEFLVLAITVSFFSITFRELASWTPPGEPAAPQAAA